jgi:uncharacterized protein YjeT (DUF2065 family)
MGIVITIGIMFAVGGLIWLYARHLGRGDVRAAFDDPPNRKKIIIIGSVLVGIGLIIFFILLGNGIIEF